MRISDWSSDVCSSDLLVTPTGEDAARLAGRIDVGSFGYVKGQASGGGVSGPLDYFVTASAQSIDGYRDHSGGNAVRGNLNIGYRIAPNIQTRFYVYAAATKQRIPGEVSKAEALTRSEARRGGKEGVRTCRSWW